MLKIKSGRGIQTKKFTGKINASTQFEGHTDALNKGRVDGEKFSIADKVAEGDSPEVLGITGTVS